MERAVSGDRQSFRGLIGAIFVATVLSVIFSTIAVYALNRYLGPVDGADTTASVAQGS